jgi:hypothetical protein
MSGGYYLKETKIRNCDHCKKPFTARKRNIGTWQPYCEECVAKKVWRYKYQFSVKGF